MKRNGISISMVIIVIFLSACFNGNEHPDDENKIKIADEYHYIKGGGYEYYTDNLSVYIKNREGNYIELTGITPDNFDFFGDDAHYGRVYYKDKKNLFYVEYDYECGHHFCSISGLNSIKKIDDFSERFEVSSKPGRIILEQNNSKDWLEKNVPFLIRNRESLFLVTSGSIILLKDINPEEYKITEGQYTYILDNDTVMLLGEQKIFENADPKSFKVIHNVYAKDNKYVYYRGKIINHSDPESFEVISYIHSKDKRNAYHWGSKIEGADSETFIETFNDRGKDKDNFYLSGKLVTDPEVIKRSFRDYYTE